MAQTLQERKAASAARVDKLPQFNFAVFSKRDGQDMTELESSWGDQEQAEHVFATNYSTWGLPDTTFYLVDWDNQVVLNTFKAQVRA